MATARWVAGAKLHAIKAFAVVGSSQFRTQIVFDSNHPAGSNDLAYFLSQLPDNFVRKFRIIARQETGSALEVNEVRFYPTLLKLGAAFLALAAHRPMIWGEGDKNWPHPYSDVRSVHGLQHRIGNMSVAGNRFSDQGHRDGAVHLEPRRESFHAHGIASTVCQQQNLVSGPDICGFDHIFDSEHHVGDLTANHKSSSPFLVFPQMAPSSRPTIGNTLNSGNFQHTQG